MDQSRSVRIFLSSTFRDFGEERDLLVRKVFPALRARLKDRFVELVDVDLRWGISVEEAERGEVLPICLAEIDRSRPFFIGMLGERYGWIPPYEGYPPNLLERQPWLKKYRGSKSVTELEILHGVLKNKRMTSRAFFYFRSPAYARSKGGHYVPDSSEDRQRQLDLKRRIKGGGFSVTSYRDPATLAKRMERDLWELLDAEFPATEVPDAFERESTRHAAYASLRRRLYLGGEKYIEGLSTLLKEDATRILITGQSGGGKSALLANAMAKHRGAKTHLLEHYLGSSSDAADTVALVRRVVDYIRRVTGNTDPVAADTEKLFESVPTWLAIASAYAQKNRTRWIFVFDALNNLTGYKDLNWFPAYLPERIQIVVSCLEGEVKEALATKGAWNSLLVEPLDLEGQRQLLTEYLRRFNKSLPAELLSQAMDYPLANNPLWLKTLAEELRLFGSHEELSNRLRTLLGRPLGKDKTEPPTVDDLFEHVLQRIEGDQGQKLVRDALAGIWASRAGLSEPELLEILATHSAKTGRVKKDDKLPPAQWAPVRNALDEMLLESGGRIIFAHDYVRLAVRGRYLQSESLQRSAHRKLADHFSRRKIDERVVEELPHQWREAKAWGQLDQTLTSLEMFEALKMHRSDEEHLGYWLSLEAVKGKQLLEARFKSSWARWRLPSSHEKTADVAGTLVEFLRYAGRGLTGSFAVLLAKKSLDITATIKGPNHIKTGIRCNTLGGLLFYKGDYEGAEPLFSRSLAIAEKVKGPEHTETGASLNLLGSLLMDKGDYEAAEPLLKRALKINEKTYGKNHFITGNSLNNLGALLQFKGDYVGAEPLYRKALAIAEKVHGPWHPDTANKLNNVGLLSKQKGNYKDAEPLMRRALAIAEKAQGPDHPATGINLNNLGILLTAIDDYDNAEPLFRRAIAISEKAQGPDHPATAINISNLGSLLKDKGDFEGAEPLLSRALAISEKAHGPDHPATGIYLNKLGLLLRDKGDYESAEPVFVRALAIAESALGSDHPDTGVRLNNLGKLFHLKGDHDAAEPMLRKAIFILEKILGFEHPSMEICVNNLGLLLHDKGDFKGAEQHFKRALSIVKTHKGENSKSAAEQHKRLGMVLRGSGRYVESREEFQKALEIFESINPRKSSEVAGVVNEIGQLEALDGNFSEAQKFFVEALEISREVSPANVEDIERRLVAAHTGRTLS